MKTIFRFIGCLTFIVVTGYAIAGGESAGKVHQVEVIKYKFIPAEITVKVGDTIRWINKEKRQYHSVWFREAGDASAPYFFPDEHYDRKFDKAGEFPYVCEPHEKDYNMIGVVHVVE